MIKEYMEYRKNKKIAKREMAKFVATTLPSINIVASKYSEVMAFVVDMIDSVQGMKGNELVETVLSKIAILLATDEPRLLEIARYITQLSSEDIQRIIAKAIIETSEE